MMPHFLYINDNLTALNIECVESLKDTGDGIAIKMKSGDVFIDREDYKKDDECCVIDEVNKMYRSIVEDLANNDETYYSPYHQNVNACLLDGCEDIRVMLQNSVIQTEEV